MIRIICYLLVFSMLFSCNENYTKITAYHNNGAVERIYYIDKDSIKQKETEVYFSNGKKKMKGSYKHGRFSDTLYYYRNDGNNNLEYQIYYYDDGTYFYQSYHTNKQLNQVGVSNKNDQRIGLWKNYDKQGNLHFIKEYKIIDGEAYTNQLWVMLPSGDTLTNGVSMKYHFDKEKVHLTDSIFCTFQMDDSAFETAENTTVDVILPEDYTRANFNADFSNFIEGPEAKNSIPIIIHPSLDRQDSGMIPTAIPPKEQNKTVAFYWKPKRLGRDTIRGFFNESHAFFDKKLPENRTSDQMMTQLNKKIYFEHPVEVIDGE